MIRARAVAAILLVASTYWSFSVSASPLTAVVNSPANLEIKLEPVVTLTGFVPIDAATIPGDGNLYVGTYIANSASVRVVNPATKTVSATPFLTFAGTGVSITGQGLQGITFSPNFSDNTMPGYRKFYTYEAETGPGGANIMFVHPEVASPSQVGVVREWTANAAGTAIDTSVASRVVFNFGTPAGHMGGGMKFGPDGYMYLATGDGGGNGNGGSTANSTDGFTGRDPTGTSSDVPGISNGQDFTNVLGKVIRIDPYTTNSDGSPRATPAGSTAKTFGGSTRYFIPGSNPFVGNAQNVYFTPTGPATRVAPLGELFAIGFRNPWKLSFDKNAQPGDQPYVSDVGSHLREEIDLVQAGGNYGWPYREGDVASEAANGRPLNSGNVPYLKQTSPGVFAQFDLDPTFSDPAQMLLPLARLGTRSVSGGMFWDRPSADQFSDGIYGDQYGDSNSVTGGFVYRGTKIPQLVGKYVFGGYELVVRANSTDYTPTSAGGRLFYFDPSEVGTYKTVQEFNYLDGFEIPANVGGDLLSVSQGDDGELYAMFANGDVKLIAAPPLAGDFNNDQVVDAADYTVWRDNLGNPGPLPNETASLGVVDSADYDAWTNNFGATSGSGAGAGSGASVPEPGSIALALVGLFEWSAFARRRRSACC